MNRFAEILCLCAVAAIATNSVIVNNAAHTSRILAFGSPMMFDPNITASKSYLNASYLVSVLNTMQYLFPLYGICLRL